MSAIYDFDAPKKATKLSPNTDLLLNTRALNTNFSATLEQALQETLKTIKTKKWQKKCYGISVYNHFVE
jgi:antitoxin CcdA